jgi:hypothetical protein
MAAQEEFQRLDKKRTAEGRFFGDRKYEGLFIVVDNVARLNLIDNFLIGVG